MWTVQTILLNQILKAAKFYFMGKRWNLKSHEVFTYAVLQYLVGYQSLAWFYEDLTICFNLMCIKFHLTKNSSKQILTNKNGPITFSWELFFVDEFLKSLLKIFLAKNSPFFQL